MKGSTIHAQLRGDSEVAFVIVSFLLVDALPVGLTLLLGMAIGLVVRARRNGFADIANHRFAIFDTFGRRH